MVLLLILLMAVACRGLKFSGRDWHDPFDREGTACVKGFFIGWVFLSHLSGYLTGANVALPFDRAFLALNGRMGQMMVVMFLVYSGYGVMRSILTKGEEYIRQMPRKRLLTTLVNFDVAVAAFLLLALALGTSVSLRQVLLSLIAWDSLGNSNWYIFVILVCYAAAWLAALVCRGSKATWIVTGLLLTGVMVALSFVKGNWWYDTMLSFPFGCLVAAYEKPIVDWCRRWYVLALLGSGIGCLALMRLQPDAFGVIRNVQAMCFATSVLLITQKLRPTCSILAWMGKRLFPLYIYQRLPMIAFASLGGGWLMREWTFAYALVCLAVTGAIGWLWGRGRE